MRFLWQDSYLYDQFLAVHGFWGRGFGVQGRGVILSGRGRVVVLDVDRWFVHLLVDKFEPSFHGHDGFAALLL